MQKTVWLYVLIVVTAAAGGWIYFARQQATTQPPVSQPPASSETIVVKPAPSDEDLNRKRLEGIGSIKDLRPVPIDPNSDRSNNK